MTTRTLPFALLLLAACGNDLPLARIDDKYDAGAEGADLARPAPPTRLPCDVQKVLQERCVSCHGDPPLIGPVALVTRDQLIALRKTSPAKRLIDLSIERMQDAKAPMPPSPPAATLAEIAVLQAWVKAGTKEAYCAPVEDPFAKPPTCTSGRMYTRGNGETMEPGNACIDCHMRDAEPPQFTLAGTIYPSGHEPARCNGVDGTAVGVTVVITGKDGKVITLTPQTRNSKITSGPNSVGNFYYTGPLALPYTVKLVAGGRERAMSSAQSDGDCNVCHTRDGASKAPGRIVMP